MPFPTQKISAISLCEGYVMEIVCQVVSGLTPRLCQGFGGRGLRAKLLLMKYLTPKGSAKPYPDGQRVAIKASGFEGAVRGRCRCTYPTLHYEVVMDSGNLIVLDHSEIVPLSSESNLASRC